MRSYFKKNKNLRLYIVSIHRYFYPNWFLNECARKKKVKIPGHGITESPSLLVRYRRTYVVKNFLIVRNNKLLILFLKSFSTDEVSNFLNFRKTQRPTVHKVIIFIIKKVGNIPLPFSCDWCSEAISWYKLISICIMHLKKVNYSLNE